MLKVEKLLEAAKAAHESEVRHLQLACSVLAYVPELMAENDFDEEHQGCLREAVRLAKLYGQESDLRLPMTDVLEWLSDGLKEES